MNFTTGGDFGKKELSPALRNRFTEIWVPEITDSNDMLTIIQDQMKKYGDTIMHFSKPMLEFVQWFNQADFKNQKKINSTSTKKKKKKKENWC